MPGVRAVVALLGCLAGLSAAFGRGELPALAQPTAAARIAVVPPGTQARPVTGPGEGQAAPGLLADLRQRAESSSTSWRGPGMEWTIRWRAYVAAAGELVTASGAVPVDRFDLVSQRSVSADTVVRERNPEISEDHLIVVAADADGRPLLWQAIPDPRIVRAEVISPTGELTCRVLHRADADFAIAMPLSGTAAELQIFQPRFTGTDWVLTRLGSLRLPPQ